MSKKLINKAKKKSKGGWWHTSLHDKPEIKYLKHGEYGGPYIEMGPFKTWKDAHEDLMYELNEFTEDIQNLRDKAFYLSAPKKKS